MDPAAFAKLMRGETGMASPGASSQREMRTVAMTRISSITNHEIVTSGTAITSRRDASSGDAGISGGGRGTLVSVMLMSLTVLATSTTGTAVRALWVVALALVALGTVSRMKPATPKRPAVVRVDQKPTPLYREPDRNQWKRSLGMLAGGSVVLGAIIACLAGFALAIALSLVSGLLRS